MTAELDDNKLISSPACATEGTGVLHVEAREYIRNRPQAQTLDDEGCIRVAPCNDRDTTESATVVKVLRNDLDI